MSQRAVLATAVLTLMLSACNGGSSTLTPMTRGSTPAPGSSPTSSPTPTSVANGPTGTATVTLTFPAVSSSMARKRQYLSAKTQSLELVVESVNGVAPTTIIATTVALGSGTSGCATGSSGLTCTFSIAAPVGNDVFTIRTYALAAAAGNPISIGTASATIVAGTAVTLSTPFLPVVSAFTLTETPPSLTIGTAGKVTLTIAASDSAGDIIGGTEPYYLPITVTTADTSGHVTASPALPAQITTPGQSITLAYDGLGTASSYIFDVAVVGDAIAQDILPQTTTLAFSGGGQHLYVTEQAASKVLVYDIAADGSLTGPSRVLVGSATQLAGPTSIAVDALGTMYVCNLGKSVTVYSPGSNGNAAPVATFANGADPQFVASDGPLRFVVGFVPNDATGKPNPANGMIASLSDYSAPVTPGGPVNLHPDVVLDLPNAESFSESGSLVCAAGETIGSQCFTNPIVGPLDPAGNVIPTRLFVIDGLVHAVAIRPDGLIVTADAANFNSSAEIVTFDPKSFYGDGSAQFPVSKYSLVGSNTGFALPTGIAFDTLGNMYVDDYGQATSAGTVKQFPMNATGNVAPTRTLSGLVSNFGIAVGP